MGMGAEWGQGTEEGPAQTETRRQLCFGALSFWPRSLPTWSSKAVARLPPGTVPPGRPVPSPRGPRGQPRASVLSSGREGGFPFFLREVCMR